MNQKTYNKIQIVKSMLLILHNEIATGINSSPEELLSFIARAIEILQEIYPIKQFSAAPPRVLLDSRLTAFRQKRGFALECLSSRHVPYREPFSDNIKNR